MKWDDIEPKVVKWDDIQESTGSPMGRAMNVLKQAVVGEKEDYPELPPLLGANAQDARTVGGMMGIIRNEYPNAELHMDKYGNPLVKPGDFKGREPLFRRHGKDQLFYVNRPGLSLGDIGAVQSGLKRAALPVAASVVAGPAGWATALPIVGGAGALSEGMAQVGANISGADEGYSVPSMLMAAGYTAGGEGAGRVIAAGIGIAANIFRRLAGKFSAPTVQFIDDTGNLTDEAIDILRKNDLTPDDLTPMLRRELDNADVLTSDQALRYNEFRDVGIKPTRGQVTRDPAQQSFEYNAPGEHGASISGRMAEQNKRLLDEAQELRASIGGADDVEAVGSSVQSALGKKSAEMKKGVSNIYESARKAKGINSPLPEESKNVFFQEAVLVLDDFEDVLPSVIKNRLLGYGTLGETTRQLTVGETDKFIKLLNSHYNPMNPPQALAIDKLRNAMKEAVDVMGKGKGTSAGLFAKGRLAASARHAEFSQKDIVEQVVKKKASVTDTIPAEKIFNKTILNGSIQDVKKIVKSLSTGTPKQVERGMKAIKDIKAATVQHLYNKATARNTVDQFGNPIFSSAIFKKEMDRIGMKKISAIMAPDELSQLKTIVLIGELRIPVEGALNTSRTSTAGFNLLERMMGKLPGGKVALGAYRFGKVAQQETRLAEEAARALNPEQATVRALVEGQKKVLPSRAAKIIPRFGAAAGAQRSDRR